MRGAVMLRHQSENQRRENATSRLFLLGGEDEELKALPFRGLHRARFGFTRRQ